VAHSGAK
nr:Chain T, Bifunctional Protein Ncoat [Homo sapiens]